MIEREDIERIARILLREAGLYREIDSLTAGGTVEVRVRDAYIHDKILLFKEDRQELQTVVDRLREQISAYKRAVDLLSQSARVISETLKGD